MAKKQAINLADYITPLRMNGLKGRMLHMPGKKGKTKEILLVYGLHASIERMFGFADDLSQYGNITIPDLPGFGGMDSFHKIGETPTLDNLADYLASFIKLRYKRKRLTILAMSYGFVVVTRMLQKHPELVGKVDLLVSLAGFVHHGDFRMKKLDHLGVSAAAWLGSHRLPAWYIRNIIFRGPVIRGVYRLMAKKHRKLYDADKEELKKRIDFEVNLWQINDARTKGRVVRDMFKVDLCRQQINLPVYHVSIADDHFFDNHIVEQHMRVIYKGYVGIKASIGGKHAPTVIADAASAAPFVPKQLRRLLARKK